MNWYCGTFTVKIMFESIVTSRTGVLNESMFFQNLYKIHAIYLRKFRHELYL